MNWVATADTLVIDAHVHIHNCFTLSQFLDEAHGQFEHAAAELGLGRFTGVLLLADPDGADTFARLADLLAGGPPGAWRSSPCDQSGAIWLRRPDRAPIALLAGRQLVSREGIEVLALATAATLRSGDALPEVLAAVRGADGLAVLPWGFGKWWGRRGLLVRRALAAASPPDLFVGDNGNRPALWPEPAAFAVARRRGLSILPGSDPLPFRTHQNRAGSYGIVVSGQLGASSPASDLKRLLRDGSVRPRLYGRLAHPDRFAIDQVRMQVRKLARRLGR